MMQPAFVVLGHHYQETTAAILPGHSSVVAVANNGAWPSVEIQERMLGADVGGGRGHGSGVSVVQCGVVVSVWNGNASYDDAGGPLSCLTAAAAATAAMKTTKEDVLEEESMLSAMLLRSKEAPFVVDLSDYCSESSPSCSVAAVLCCGNDVDDATAERANATVTTTLLLERARRAQGEEDVDHGVAEQVRVVAMEDTGHVAEGVMLEKPVAEVAVEVLPRDRSDKMVFLQQQEEDGRREEEDPSPPQPGALVQPLLSSSSSPPTMPPPPPGEEESQARHESLPGNI